MNPRILRKLSFAKKLLLAVAGIAAMGSPIFFGLVNTAHSQGRLQSVEVTTREMSSLPLEKSPKILLAQTSISSSARNPKVANSQKAEATTPLAFEVASIGPSAPLSREDLIAAKSSGTSPSHILVTPGSLTMRNFSLKGSIGFAYRVNTNYQIVGGPNWIGNDNYDILARTAGPASEDQLRLMLQSLLAERFNVILHRETKAMPALALIIGKNGSKLHPSEGEGNAGISIVSSRSTIPAFALEARHTLMPRFAAFLTTFIANGPSQLTPVLDMTGLTDQFDFTLDLSGWDLQGKSEDIAASRKDVVMAAIQEQLGLKLESRKVPIEILVVDRAEKPTEN